MSCEFVVCDAHVVVYADVVAEGDVAHALTSMRMVVVVRIAELIVLLRRRRATTIMHMM